MSNISFTLESDTDENFFGNLERKHSNLEQLFGIGANIDNADHTLKYQPTKLQVGTALTGLATVLNQIWNTQLAKVANAYKAGELVGKVGVAFLTNPTENATKIVVYKTKANVLATCSLNFSIAGVQLYRQSRYLQFYDDEKVYWSLRFDKDVDECEFIEKLEEFNVQIMPEKIENVVETSSVISAKEPKEITKFETYKPTGKILKSNMVEKDTHSKTALLTRMAKMGQQLPKSTTVALSRHEYSDCSDTNTITLPMYSNKPSIMPRSSKLQMKTQVVPASNAGLYNATGTIANVNAIEAQVFQMMLTENRTQNTEMRMNMNKLESKIEKVLDKIEIFNAGTNQKSSKEDEILELEEKLLELKKENRKLKQSLEKRDQSSDLKVVDQVLEIYKEDLSAIGMLPNNNLNTIISNLIERTIKLQNNLEFRESELERKSKKLQQSEIKLNEEKEKNSNALKKIMELENINTTLQTKLENKEQDNKMPEPAALSMDQNTLETSETEAIIKQIMNCLYGNLSFKIESVDKLDKNLIIALIGKTIREETLKGIEQIKSRN